MSQNSHEDVIGYFVDGTTQPISNDRQDAMPVEKAEDTIVKSWREPRVGIKSDLDSYR